MGEEERVVMEQLESVAFLARYIPDSVLAQLQQQVMLRLQQLAAAETALAAGQPLSFQLEQVEEELRWLLLLAMHLLADSHEGEYPHIPPCLRALCRAQHRVREDMKRGGRRENRRRGLSIP